MAQTKPLDQITAKFVRNAQAGAQSYTEGVQAPRRDWATATKAAEPSFEAGIQAAIGRKAFGKGVTRTGSQKQITAAVTKGSVRFGPGVATSQQAYSDGFAPYLQVIAGVNLPPRRARRDPSNLQRVAAIAQALGAAKEARSKA